MTALQAAMDLATSLDRSNRTAQGYTRIRDFAAAVAAKRAKRATARECGPDSIQLARQAVVDRLRAACRCPEFIAAARNEAGIRRHDTFPAPVIEWSRKNECEERGSGYVKYHWRNCGASGTVYHPSTRYIHVSALWALKWLKATGTVASPEPQGSQVS